ncbi:MAG: ribosome silencing factor [Acidimicrobiia bacterium]|nr:ribosome silencing factor [Acidimicrobiia bacterium]MYC86038.1 ribosome silencing factor [Acidimicrobiia bacterium]
MPRGGGANPGRPAIEQQQATGIELTSSELAVIAAHAIDAKQGTDVVILDMGDLLGIVDIFVIGSGTSKRQVRTMIEEVNLRLGRRGRKPLRTEGLDTGEWVLADYGDLVVHIFQTGARDFYALDRLWGDAPRLQWAPDPRD